MKADHATSERRKKLLQRLEGARNEQSTWRPHWQEISEWIEPRRGRFLVSDRNNGSRRNQHIINSTAVFAKGVAQAGMSSGVTDPARPWFNLGTSNPKLGKMSSVRQYLADCETEMYGALARSNFYPTVSDLYGDLLDFGTAVLHLEPDPQTTLRAFNFPVGQFYLVTDSRGEVVGCYREFSMTVAQLVERFGLEACSDRAQALYKENKVNEWIEVLHAVEPNGYYEQGKIGRKSKRVSSCWLETKADAMSGFLRESGFDQMRTLGVRWQASGEDVYGRSLAMTVLGDVKGLQLLEKEKLKLVQKMADPPMMGPASLKNRRVSLLPGDYTPVVANEGRLEPAQVVNPNALTALRAEIEAHEFRIARGFKSDLWLMLTNGGDTQKTAREIAARETEKLLQLGPVLVRLFSEMLRPTIEIVFAICLEAGLLPPPPPEMEGQEIKVEFVSALAVAMKLAGITSLERFSGFVMQWDAVDPSLKDNVDRDKMVADYADRVGVPPDLIRGEEEVKAMRDARAKMQAQAAQAEQNALAARAGRDMAATPIDGNTAASRLVDVMGGPRPGVPGDL